MLTEATRPKLVRRPTFSNRVVRGLYIVSQLAESQLHELGRNAETYQVIQSGDGYHALVWIKGMIRWRDYRRNLRDWYRARGIKEGE